MKSAEKISIKEFREGHPENLICSTDQVYTKLANKYYEVLLNDLPMEALNSLKDKDSVKRIAIKLALYFEDRYSNLFLWDTFLDVYSKKYGKEIPFYNYGDTDQEKFFSELKLAIWMFLIQEMEYNFINPSFPIFETIAVDIADVNFNYMQKGEEFPANEELVYLLYLDEKTPDFMRIKTVLMWLENRCYLGNWGPVDGRDIEDFIQFFHGASSQLLEYCCRSTYAFVKRSWPLSMRPQDIYASILRYVFEDDEDVGAQLIADIEFRNVEIYRIESIGRSIVKLRNYKDEIFETDIKSFSKFEKKKDTVLLALTKFDGLWRATGCASFLNSDENTWSMYVAEQLELQNSRTNNGPFGKAVEMNKGRRLFYFKGTDEFRKWMTNDLGLSNVTGMLNSELKKKVSSEEIAVFVEKNCQISMIFIPFMIKDKKNPFFDKNFVHLDFLMNKCTCTPDCLRYMIDNGYLSHLSCSSVNKGKRDLKIVQDNIEFIACFYRKDIDWN